jgi:hypothetical protein
VNASFAHIAALRVSRVCETSAASMLMRSLKVPPSVLLILGFLLFLGLHFSQVPLPPQPVRPPPPEKKTPRIALVTFVTEERSYLHLALKSKNREFPAFLARGCVHSYIARLLSSTRL